MPNEPKIRWLNRDSELAEKLISRYNRKLYKEHKAVPMEDYKEKRMNMTKLKSEVETRKDFKRIIREMEDFLDTPSPKVKKPSINPHLTDEEINRGLDVGRRFNQRVAYQHKKNEDTSFLPNKIDVVDQLKKMLSSRDLQRWIDKLERFTNETAKKFDSPHNINRTEWAINEAMISLGYDNQRKAEEWEWLQKVKIEINGEVTRFSGRDLLPLEDELQYREVKKDPTKMTQKQWERFEESMDQRMYETYTLEKKQRWMQNYIRGMIYAGMPDDLLEIVKGVDLETFYKVMLTNKLADVKYWYSKEQYDNLVLTLHKVWDEHYDPDVVNDFVDFEELKRESKNKWSK